MSKSEKNVYELISLFECSFRTDIKMSKSKVPLNKEADITVSHSPLNADRTVSHSPLNTDRTVSHSPLSLGNVIKRAFFDK